MFKIITNKREFTIPNKEKLEMFAVLKCQDARVFSDYCISRYKDIDRTIEILGNLGYAVEEIEEDLDIEDKEGEYEANVLYAEMVAQQVISY